MRFGHRYLGSREILQDLGKNQHGIHQLSWEEAAMGCCSFGNHFSTAYPDLNQGMISVPESRWEVPGLQTCKISLSIGEQNINELT